MNSCEKKFFEGGESHCSKKTFAFGAAPDRAPNLRISDGFFDDCGIVAIIVRILRPTP